MDAARRPVYAKAMRVTVLFAVAAPLLLANCASVQNVFGAGDAPAQTTAVSGQDPVLKPQPRPTEEVPVALPVSGTDALGTTIASLGDPALPGLWMETPLVTREQTGTVQYRETTVALTLRPTGGAAGSGSRLSLLAMQALGAPLTELVEVRVVGAR